MFVGAYAAAASSDPWGPRMSSAFTAGLTSIDGVDGVEAPWAPEHGDAHVEWMLSWLPTHWSIVLTDIPHVMARLRTSAAYGLASATGSGRIDALADLAELRQQVGRFAEAGLKVDAVEIHSAPQGANAVAFEASVQEFASWDWHGAEVLIEHCDALIAGQPPEKGFLDLAQELAIVRRARGRVGVALNWGRSAIELRDADRVVEHLQAAHDSGALRTLVVSGASEASGAYGHAWRDAHLPFAEDLGDAHADTAPFSMLTTRRLREALSLVGHRVRLGVKVGVRPQDASTADRLATIDRTVQRVQQATMESRSNARQSSSSTSCQVTARMDQPVTAERRPARHRRSRDAPGAAG